MKEKTTPGSYINMLFAGFPEERGQLCSSLHMADGEVCRALMRSKAKPG